MRRFIENLIDDNYILSSERAGTLYEVHYSGKNYTFIKGVSRYLFRFAKSFRYFNILIFFHKNRNGLALIGSINTETTLEPIKEKLNFNIVSIYLNSSKAKSFPFLSVYLLSIIFLPFLPVIFFFSNNYTRKTFKYSIDEFALVLSYRLLFGVYLFCTNTKYLIVSNDHLLYFRSAIKVANYMNIPTYYVQHASITDKFPKLISKYAFLDGEDAKRKYFSNHENTTTEVFMTGSSRYDILFQYKKEVSCIKKIGIATNEFDDLNLTKYLLSFFCKEYELLLRPHPSDSNFDKWKEMAFELGIEFSDSTKVSYFEYLSSIDSIISCNSNILLEAVICGIPSFSYQFSLKTMDHYGFVENQLVDHFTDVNILNDVIIKFNQDKKFISNCKYFYDFYGTDKEGTSTLEIVKLINKTLNS